MGQQDQTGISLYFEQQAAKDWKRASNKGNQPSHVQASEEHEVIFSIPSLFELVHRTNNKMSRSLT